MDGARQERLNVHLAIILSRLGLPTQAEVTKRWRKTPDLTVYHPLLGVILGEAEVGDGWDDEPARRRLNSRVAARFSDPQFDFIDNILLLIYPRHLLQESVKVGEAEIGRLFNTHPVGLGLAWRLREPLDPSKWVQQLECSSTANLSDSSLRA